MKIAIIGHGNVGGALARRWGAYWQSWRGGRDEKKPALAA